MVTSSYLGFFFVVNWCLSYNEITLLQTSPCLHCHKIPPDAVYLDIIPDLCLNGSSIFLCVLCWEIIPRAIRDGDRETQSARTPEAAGEIGQLIILSCAHALWFSPMVGGAGSWEVTELWLGLQRRRSVWGTCLASRRAFVEIPSTEAGHSSVCLSTQGWEDRDWRVPGPVAQSSSSNNKPGTCEEVKQKWTWNYVFLHEALYLELS